MYISIQKKKQQTNEKRIDTKTEKICEQKQQQKNNKIKQKTSQEDVTPKKLWILQLCLLICLYINFNIPLTDSKKCFNFKTLRYLEPCET